MEEHCGSNIDITNIAKLYINTNEIPGELWHENISSHMKNKMLSSHVKRSLLLWLHNESHLSQQKVKWFWYFIAVHIINRIEC